VRRFGLVWRIALIVIAALVAIQLIAAAAYYVQRGRATEQGFRLPLPDQIAALVQLIESAPEPERALALRIANGGGLRATVEREAPPLPASADRVAWLELAIARYLDDGRDVQAYFLGQPLRPLRFRPRLFEGLGFRPVRIVVPLKQGALVAETIDELTVPMLGLPPGFWAGIIGFVVAALALYAVVRETRPLARLARSIDRFGEAIKPQPVPERGAREVRALIGAVNRMQLRIAELVASRTFVLAAISHDLRTYLTRLRLRVEIIDDAKLRQAAVRDVEEMDAMLDEALLFARSSFANGERTPVDLAAVVGRECEARAGQPVHADLPAAPVMVLGDRAALSRIVANLVDNAVKYGGEAAVTVGREREWGEIVVDDRGPGIPAADRERIFEPFLRLEPSRNRDCGGAGLGLAIAHHLVAAHGGTIAVEDRTGGGARFRVRLPLAPSASQEPAGRVNLQPTSA
jgi:signal transduction histidine kinase